MYFLLVGKLFSFTEIDEDEPLNLSTKSTRSSSNAIIWSPASICEKESSAGGVPIKLEIDQMHLEPSTAAAAAAVVAAALNPNHIHASTANSSTTSSSSSSSSSTSSSASSVSSLRLPQPLPIQELIEKAHANGLSADLLQKLQRRTNEATNSAFPSSLTQAAAAAAAAAAAVQAATNTTEFLSHLHKQAEFDLIAKNHLDLYAENLLNSNEARRNNNEKLRNVNYNNNNNNNDTTLNDANKHCGTHKTMNIKSEGPKNSRSVDGNRMQKLFQVRKRF